MRNSSRRRAAWCAILAIAAVLIISGCSESEGTGEESDSSAHDRPLVVSTTTFIGDVVEQVIGDAGKLSILLPRGANPHSYQPTARDLQTLAEADIVFKNGLGLEEEFLDDLESVAGGVVVDLSEGIAALEVHRGSSDDHDDDDEDHDDDGDHDHDGGLDPHVWFNPRNAAIWVSTIADAWDTAGYSVGEEIRARAAQYRDELEALDGRIQAIIEQVPADRRRIVMDHASLLYFAERYGLVIDETLIDGGSDRAEPSPRDIARIVEEVRSAGIQTIFVGGTASEGLSDLANAVVNEVSSGMTVTVLLTGSLSESGRRGDSYLDFMQFNAEQIAKGLSGP